MFNLDERRSMFNLDEKLDIQRSPEHPDELKELSEFFNMRLGAVITPYVG
jgi:hypothetical protein